HELLTNTQMGCAVAVTDSRPERAGSESTAHNRDRYGVGWREEPPSTRVLRIPRIPARCVLLTSDSTLVTHLELPVDADVMTAGPTTEDGLAEAFARQDRSRRRLLVVIRADATHDTDAAAFEK